jgi:hypothetical protein
LMEYPPSHISKASSHYLFNMQDIMAWYNLLSD